MKQELSSNTKHSLNEISRVSSNDENWLVGYFRNQSVGLAELACETKIDSPQMEKFVNETILLARAMRAELTKRFDLVMFGRNHLFINGTSIIFTIGVRYD